MSEVREFKTESKRLLNLMINSIYTNKEIFLRELISNASDAIDKYHYMSLTEDKLPKKNDYEINLSYDSKKRTFTIKDNGIGMTYDELVNSLGTIAKSGSLEFMEKLKDEEFLDNELDTLQFMINLYHSLDEVEVLGDRLNISEYKNSSSFSLDNGKELVRIYMGVGNLMADKLYEPIFVYKGKYIYVYNFDLDTKKAVSKEKFENCNNLCLRESKQDDYYEYMILNKDKYLNIRIRFKQNNFDRSILTNYLKNNDDLYGIDSVLPKEDLIIEYTTPLNSELFIYRNNELVDDIKKGVFPEEMEIASDEAEIQL